MATCRNISSVVAEYITVYVIQLQQLYNFVENNNTIRYILPCFNFNSKLICFAKNKV